MHTELAPVVSPPPAEQLAAAARAFLTVYERTLITPELLRRPTVKELRARGVTHSTFDVDPTFARIFRDAQEPKRQRKDRVMAPRKLYRLAKVDSTATLKALTRMTPAATTIVMYLATHPGQTVPDLVHALDLRRKTVENLLSLLRKQGIIESVDRE